jgi:hypothetical protein
MRANVICIGLLLGVLSLGLGAPLPAGEVRDLYEARVEVADKGDEARKPALGAALLQVIVKVSGSRKPGANTVIAAALESPRRYVQQFRYSNLESPAGGEESSPEAPAFELWARFDPRVVDPLIREAGLPVWGRVRPAVLALVAVEGSGARELLGSDDPGGWSALLQGAAGDRGLPLVLPLMDLQDRARLRSSDVWAGFDDSVLGASQRYQSEAVLLGSVFPVAADAWEARWRLLLDDSRHEWVAQGERLESVLVEGIHESADLLASRFGGFTGALGPSGVELTVTGVRSLDDYARALGYLGSLDQVSRVQVTRVAADGIVFLVDARGGREAIRQVIALGRTLMEDDQQQWGSGLAYRLSP